MMTIIELKDGEVGERVSLEKLFQWILEDMSYEDFYRLTTLRFYTARTEEGYPFNYTYRVNKEADSAESRKDYIKYLGYKLVQNLDTDGISLL